MLFTVVTILFVSTWPSNFLGLAPDDCQNNKLPLSFMSAFFAIEIDAFPVDENGKLEMNYVLKYMRK